MDLDEFKDAITCKNPLFDDWKFGAKVDVPLVKILPETRMTEEDLAKLIHYELEEKAGVQKFAKTAMERYKEECRRADERARKHRIFIACPSHRDIGNYITMLLDALLDKDIPVVRIKRHTGELETEHVIARMITPGMHREGLRCDECFGFTYNEAMILKKAHTQGYNNLRAVPDYIKYVEKVKNEEEKEKAKEMHFHMNYDFTIPALKKPTIKDVIFNDPATIVMWSDGTKTVVKAEGEDFDPEKGLAMAISKKNLGNKYDYYNTFKHWLKKYYKEHPAQEKDAEWTVAAKPVDVAYHTLLNIISAKGAKPTKPELEAAIQEAIGFLGEALDK